MSSNLKKNRGGLRRQMHFYMMFQFAIFATMAVEMTVFIRGDAIAGQLLAMAANCGLNEIEVLAPIDLLLAKVAIMLFVLLLTVALVMILFMKRITIPLAEITDAAARIADGDLSATAPVHFKDEIGLLANSINDLSANYQEVLLLAQDLAGRAAAELEGDEGSHSASQRKGSPLHEYVGELNQLLDEFSRTFFKPGSER